MSLKLRLKRVYPFLLMAGITVGELLLLAPIYPYESRVVHTTITLPLSLDDCEALVWIANGRIGADLNWITVDVQVDLSFGSEPVHVKIEDPFGPTFLNETNTKVQAVLPARWLYEGYFVTVENPGTAPCYGSAVGVFGAIEFWHMETRRRSVLFPEGAT